MKILIQSDNYSDKSRIYSCKSAKEAISFAMYYKYRNYSLTYNSNGVVLENK